MEHRAKSYARFMEGTSSYVLRRHNSAGNEAAEQSVSASDSVAQSSLEKVIGIRQMNQGGLRCKAKTQGDSQPN